MEKKLIFDAVDVDFIPITFKRNDVLTVGIQVRNLGNINGDVKLLTVNTGLGSEKSHFMTNLEFNLKMPR